MTLKVRIENQGNQPSDCFIIRGMKTVPMSSGEYFAKESDDPNDVVTLIAGEGIDLYPSNTGHFDDFVDISYKGKH